jgi:hypothetical protein
MKKVPLKNTYSYDGNIAASFDETSFILEMLDPLGVAQISYHCHRTADLTLMYGNLNNLLHACFEYSNYTTLTPIGFFVDWQPSDTVLYKVHSCSRYCSYPSIRPARCPTSDLRSSSGRSTSLPRISQISDPRTEDVMIHVSHRRKRRFS